MGGLKSFRWNLQNRRSFKQQNAILHEILRPLEPPFLYNELQQITQWP